MNRSESPAASPARAPLGALPRRMRRSRLLIVGCGDVGLRVARQNPGGEAGPRLLALTSQAGRRDELRALGITPLLGNLDDPASLRRLAALAGRVLHLAPPPGHGDGDPRTLALLRSLARSGAVQRLVYASTTGVYGDAGGIRFDETRATAPASARGQRRVVAEHQIRAWALRHGVCASVLRIPGIYALDRPGGHPRERLLRGTPVLRDEDDVHTNHIHADDLARACRAALWRGAPQRVYHACDDSALKMGEYFDLAADLCGLPRPPRISRADAQTQLSPMLLSFMSESRQLDNRRLKRELRVTLRHPHVRTGLLA
ncbi:SDR family oxidoreductase [Leptothrix sp. BB-4]